MPEFAPSSARGIGLFFDEAGEPSLVASVAHTDPVELDWRMPPRPSNVAVWCGPEESQTWARETAKARNLPWLYYADRHGLRPADVPEGARAAVYAYPGEALSVAETVSRTLDDLDALTAEGIPCDLVVALYCGWRNGVYRWDEQHVLDVLEAVWPLAEEFSVGAIWGFAKFRFNGAALVDGTDKFPNLHNALWLMRKASRDWRQFPTVEPVSVPTPLPTPLPVPIPFMTRARSL